MTYQRATEDIIVRICRHQGLWDVGFDIQNCSSLQKDVHERRVLIRWRSTDKRNIANGRIETFKIERILLAFRFCEIWNF